MNTVDHTHAADLRSWVETANSHSDFPIQNLPIGIFSANDGKRRAGVAIGNQIIDLAALLASGLVDGDARHFVEASTGGTLNAALALGAGPRRALRLRLSELLRAGATDENLVRPCLHDAASCTLHMPASVGDYTDFYVGIHHATNIGKMFRPDNPLLPNYKYVPIGYHGRASSLRPSGTPVRRPKGQTKAPDAAGPTFGPSRRLDFELEVGIWVGPGNALGEAIPIDQAAGHIAGYCLLNDWSARDVQAWEYQPLGPFLAKNFGSTISAWIIMPEALAPFRVAQPARPPGDPAPLSYLDDAVDQREGAFAIALEVFIRTARMKAEAQPPHRISLSDTRHMYWTAAQLIAHHTCGGCNLNPGDLIGTGTISAPDGAGVGSIIEATSGGKKPIQLPNGEERSFVEDGDEVIFVARCTREGFSSIGFGECRAEVLPA